MLETKIFRYKKLKSTNTKLKELQSVERLPEFSIVITDNQTNGRGQHGNFWESEKNKNLTFSVLLYPHFIEIKHQFNIAIIITVALVDVLKKYLINVKIKWPNDIYAYDKKISGILIENSIIGDKIDYSVVGIGLNVNQLQFVSDAKNPVSMKILTGKEFDAKLLLHEIITEIIARYSQCVEHGFKNIQNQYHENLYWINEAHTFKDENGIFQGKIELVEETGHLVMTDSENNRRKYAFKEIEFLQ